MTQSYNYLVSDTANNKVDIESLRTEIETSSISRSLDYANTPMSLSNNDLIITFTIALLASEKTELDSIVANHEGIETVNIEEIQLKDRTPVSNIPRVAVYEPEGDFQSIVSHDFTDNTTWPATDDSSFVLEPGENMDMKIKKAEVQFTHDIQLQGVTELYFDIWVYNPLFDQNQPIVSEDDTWFPGKTSEPFRNQLRFLFERKVYASIKDVMNIGNAHYTMPGVDNIANSLTTVQFDYPRAIDLLASQGAQIRVNVKDNVPINGEFCTITFTTSEEPENV